MKFFKKLFAKRNVVEYTKAADNRTLEEKVFDGDMSYYAYWDELFLKKVMQLLIDKPEDFTFNYEIGKYGGYVTHISGEIAIYNDGTSVHTGELGIFKSRKGTAEQQKLLRKLIFPIIKRTINAHLASFDKTQPNA